MEATLNKLRQTLTPLYGRRETEAIIRLIFHYLKGWNLTEMLIHQQDELSDFVKEEIEDILKRLKEFEPIQYITGEARFHGLDLKVNPGVLIPRPETDELVDIIVDANKDREDLKILDLCTGSGAIALALARSLPFSKVTAIDFSPVAVETARLNSSKLKTKIEVEQADIFDWEPKGKFDIIVANPPYVMDKEALQMERNVLDYEPHEALFVRDDNPLQFYKRITDIAKKVLVAGGKLYFEINPLTAQSLKEMIEKKGFQDVEILKDSSGKDRFLSCVS
ncbi:MAG: peptide chain release factor N(5)-glutamine methyltransferase [Muribaculaceae bacterium]|nr:peptide chain release factor N(5)-glutamine methyltransferase [Muribaculaceae bacterium]